MNEREQELFEAELRSLNPARLPDEFESRLCARPAVASPEFTRPPRSQVWRPGGRAWLQWFAPVAAVAVALLATLAQLNRGRNSAPHAAARPAPALNADQVEIDRQWLGSFEAVANMPEGEPVRFQFQQWMDAVTLRDSVHGVEVVQRIPRIEVVPVGFATY